MIAVNLLHVKKLSYYLKIWYKLCYQLLKKILMHFLYLQLYY